MFQRVSDQWIGFVVNGFYETVKNCNKIIPFIFTIQLSKLLSGCQITNDGNDRRLINVLFDNGILKISKRVGLYCKISVGETVELSDIMLSIECMDLDDDVRNAWREALEMTIEYIKDFFCAEVLRLFLDCSVEFKEVSEGCLRIFIASKNGDEIARHVIISTY